MLGSVRGNGLAVMAALGLLVLVGVLFAKPAHAETFTVNSTTNLGTDGCDATECTLKEAIDTANANGESDTIGFAPALSGEIELSDSSTAAGQFFIQNDTPDEDLRIDGPGAGVLAVDANNQTRAFEIASGAKATIEGLTIKNGSTAGRGGGILNEGTLTLTDSTISGNSADYEAGGIYNGYGTLTLTDSTLSGNSARFGGGILTRGGEATLTLTDSTLSGNSADYEGGGIANYGGTLTLANSTLSENSVRLGGGGGIDNYGGTLKVTDSTLSGNSAGRGGGIATSGGTLTLTDSTLSGNSARYGGGGISSVDGDEDGGKLKVTNSTISGNSSSESVGGGIYNGYEATLTLTNSTISGNFALLGGGGILTRSGGTMANTIVAGNIASEGGPDASGFQFTSQGYNLIGKTRGSSGWEGSDLLNEDPFLRPLHNNGGPTKTHALRPASPALNAIPKGTNGCSTTITTDQRGVTRPQGGACEIGSFEAEESPKVNRVVPKEGAPGVAPGTTVRAFFSEEMRKGTINANTVKLYKVGRTLTIVEAQVEYAAAADKAILTPTSPLERGKRYKAVVTTGAKDLAGNRLDQDRDPANGNQPKSWTFTVKR